jgi:hypothetical protein
MQGDAAQWWTHVPLIGSSVSVALGKVSEGWMPFVAGLHFLPLFFISVVLLNQLPRPNKADVDEWVERSPMNRDDRLAFVRQFLFGLVLLCGAYFFLTAYRDFRDNYQVELLDELGYSYAQNKAIISRAETLVMFGVICALGLLSLFRQNRFALIAAFSIMTTGMALIGVATLLLDAKLINGFWWMTLIGVGSYLAYVPYGSMLFDRLIASMRVVATAVFAIYVADAIGYTGSVGVQLFRDLFSSGTSRLGFFKGYSYFLSVFGSICLVWSCFYFLRKQAQTRRSATLPADSEVGTAAR